LGNPFPLNRIKEGAAVLDIGCGAGVDPILAAMMTGPSKKAVGVDMVQELLRRAEENLNMTYLAEDTGKIGC